MYNFLLIVSLLILTACASERPKESAKEEPIVAAEEPAPAPAMAPAPAPIMAPAPAAARPPHVTAAAPIPSSSVTQKLLSVRDFLVRGEPISRGFAAYGYLVLAAPPSTAEDKARYARICDAYLKNIVPKSEYTNVAPHMFATTYWLLTRRVNTSATCQSIIANYDYATAGQITSISGIPQSHRGPFIVAWTTPYQQADINTKPRLVLDLSTLPDEDMNYAIRLWKENVATNPDAWAQGRMNREVILSAFQDFLRRYSDAIIKIIS